MSTGTNRFIKKSGALHFEATEDLDNKQLYQVGHFIGVIANDYESGDTAVLDYLGVFKVPKADAAGAIDRGDPLYYDENNDALSDDDDDGSRLFAGVAESDATAGADEVRCDFTGHAKSADTADGIGLSVTAQTEDPSGTIDIELAASVSEEVELVAAAYGDDMQLDSTISLSETGDGTEESATDQSRLYFKTSAAGEATLQATQDTAATETVYIEIFPVNRAGRTYLEELSFAG